MRRPSLPVLPAALVMLSGSILAACGDGDGGGSGGAGGQSAGAGGGAAGGRGGNGPAGAGGATGVAGAGVGGAAGGASGAGVGGSSGGAGAGGAAAGGATGGAGAAGSGGGVGGAGAAGRGGAAGGGTAGGGAGGRGGTAVGGAAGTGTAGNGAGGRGGAAGTGTAGAAGTPGPLPAFPGADGAAARITGGRGGDVYHVTLLDTDFSDMRPGTLRYGLSTATSARTIVFDVSGTFSMGRTAVSGWDSKGNGWDTASRMNIPSNVTIAGQTAPGPVIIMGGGFKPGGNNIIVRNITVAPGYGNRSFDESGKPPVAGDFPDSYVYDAFDISGTNVMIDHVTTIYATDETISMNELANNVTIQYCNIALGQNYPQADAESSGVSYTGHALGSLLQAGSNARITVAHNLYAHLKGRLPRVGTEADKLTVAGVGAYNDFRNNVFYNWLSTAGTGASGQASQNNFVGNFYLAGNGGDNPSGGTSTAVSNAAGGTSIFNGSDSSLAKVFHSGNLKDTNKDGDASDGTALANSDFGTAAFQGSAFTQTPYYGVTESATVAFDRVLMYAGARFWSRGAVDARLASETRAGTGKIVAWADDPFNTSASEGTEWRALRTTPMMSRPAGYDTDGDGMPDAWEQMHGLNPAAADNNGDFDGDGFTNLEEYINEVTAWPATAALMLDGGAGGARIRYADIRNWSVGGKSGVWQPSHLDVARVRAGHAVVDAPGQHARRLDVDAASASGAPATLDIAGGWLDVAGRLEVGARGVLALAGGRLAAGELSLERGALEVDVAQLWRGAVAVRGTARLGGVLRVRARVAPRAGDSWTVLTAAGGVTGRFRSVPAGYEVTVAGTRVTLTFRGAPAYVAAR